MLDVIERLVLNKTKISIIRGPLFSVVAGEERNNTFQENVLRPAVLHERPGTIFLLKPIIYGHRKTVFFIPGKLKKPFCQYGAQKGNF